MLPSRFVDVGPADGSRHPYLYMPSKDSDYRNLSADSRRYIGLSYCWGSDPTLTTTASSLETRKKGIHMMDLPQTIYDAVVITRRLGIGYLWVDALCILQGTDDLAITDWKRESSKMADIYGNAFLTIAAAAPRSGREGIYFSRKPPNWQVAMKFSAKINPPLNGPAYVGSKLHSVLALMSPCGIAAGHCRSAYFPLA
ncbi:HET-domain-containing protein [Zopfia rhizophila CBS 207.26]|uniref:HET-domain-containing protein n=1 Tax=Zopfia rhizophila CBS 207.26 TaxID=1314779 RepID=A0A6A6DKB5_9PEZI|nr:HET-domain-containing protein [Zopfia rhizophila CBS 207.26]